jgi:EAL domain-containing protein (putative c-di-GMP-specific phosphodiesterase class I)
VVSAVGCDLAQGYFYARPMAASAIEAHLDAVAAGVAVHLPA